APPGMVACPSCGVANPVGMNFCKMCGVRIGGAPVVAAAAGPVPAASGPSPAVAAAIARTACPACGQQTPANYSFCQYCGGRLATPGLKTVGSDAVAPTLAVSPTPPAGMRVAAVPGRPGTPR